MSKRGGAKPRQKRYIAFVKQNGRCYWCGAKMTWMAPGRYYSSRDPRMCTADHLVFRAMGGKNTQDNIVAACRECNNKRHPTKKQLKTFRIAYRAAVKKIIAQRVGNKDGH